MLIRIYRKIISPILGYRCRFHPTCSQYGIEVIQKFGIFKGSWLTLSRILQCHPLNINTNKIKLQILKKKTTENIQNGLPT